MSFDSDIVANPHESGSQRIPLHHLIRRPFQAERLIGPAGRVIVALNVQANADHLRVVLGRLLHVLEQRTKDAAPPRLGPDVDALNPPEPTVAPVAPFVSDAELADDWAAVLRQKITPLGAVAERLAHAGGAFYPRSPAPICS